MNGALKPTESHHSSTSLIYTVITLSTLAQQNHHKVPESLTITPFSENSENSKLKLSCFRSLFLVMKKQSRVCHKKASTPTNQNIIILFILPQNSGTRVRLFLSSTGWELKHQVFCDGMRRDHSFDLGDVWKDVGRHVTIPRWKDSFVWYCCRCICVLWLFSWR